MTKLTSSVMLEFACSSVTLFHTPDKEAYAEIRKDGHREIYRADSSEFRSYLAHLIYVNTRCMPPGSKLDDVIINLKGQALYEGPRHEVHFCYAEENNRIYVNMANDKWEQVEISSDGRKVIPSDESPVRFIRGQGMRPLPAPADDGTPDMLRKYLNIREEHEFCLVVSWIIGALNPAGPYPVLIIQGEQGSGKSMAARILRDLTDPSNMPSRSAAGSERDLVISALHQYILNLDNMSQINGGLSDILCRISTGGGFAKRKLRTDDTEIQFNIRRPIIINGIPEDLAERHDLADRSLIVHLSPIEDKDRRTERELTAEWEQDRPKILGAFYKGVSAGLRNRGQVSLDSLPRMADFATWISEAEEGLGWESGTFMKAYEKSRETLIDNAIEGDPVASAVTELVKYRNWVGTPTQLFEVLEQYVPRTVLRSGGWPRQPNALSRRLTRLRSFLRARGIRIERIKSGERFIVIEAVS